MKILIPVDGSDQSNAALDFVASRSTLIGQDPEVHLLNVQPTLSVRVSRAIGREEAKAYQRVPRPMTCLMRGEAIRAPPPS
jgi:hypothetical protein